MIVWATRKCAGDPDAQDARGFVVRLPRMYLKGTSTIFCERLPVHTAARFAMKTCPPPASPDIYFVVDLRPPRTPRPSGGPPPTPGCGGRRHLHVRQPERPPPPANRRRQPWPAHARIDDTRAPGAGAMDRSLRLRVRVPDRSTTTCTTRPAPATHGCGFRDGIRTCRRHRPRALRPHPARAASRVPAPPRAAALATAHSACGRRISSLTASANSRGAWPRNGRARPAAMASRHPASSTAPSRHSSRVKK